MIPKQLGIKSNFFVARVEIYFVRHVKIYVQYVHRKVSTTLYLFLLIYLMLHTVGAHLRKNCRPPCTLKRTQAIIVYDTGYNYKQGVGKTKVVRSPSP